MPKALLIVLSIVAVRALAPATAVAPVTGIDRSFRPGHEAAPALDGMLPGGFDASLAFASRHPFDSTLNSIGMEFVLLPPGSFVMGIPGADDNAWRAHRVTLTRGFWIGRFEVLASELDGTEVRGRASGERIPAEQMAWRDAVRFLNALSRREGLEPCYTEYGEVVDGDVYACEGYRLPTEAEWAYAARAGRPSEAWEGDRSPQAWAWFHGNCGPDDSSARPVGLRRPNPWGLHDFQGNVREWVHDRWSPATVTGDRIDPLGPTTGWNRVVRGGRCASSARGVSTTHRIGVDASERTAGTGFRVVRSAR